MTISKPRGVFMAKSDKSNSKPTKDRLLNQYETILIALQGLYTDCHNTADKLHQLETDLQDVKKTLIDILKYSKELSEFETKIFRNNLSK